MIPSSDLEQLQAYLDGQLSYDYQRAFEARIKAEPTLAEALLMLAREEAVLKEWARSEKAVQSQLVTHPFRQPARSRFRIAIQVAAALLLVACLAALLGVFPTTPEPNAAVAEVEEVQGEVFVLTPDGQSQPAVSGQELFSGQGLKTSGDQSSAVVRYPDKTRLEIGADTIIRLATEAITGKKVNLAEGIVTAEVVKQLDGQPMILTTPHLEVRGQETRFSSASLADLSRIDPERGWLQVTRRSDGASADVTFGSYLVASREDTVPGVRPFVPQPLPASFKKPRAVLRDGTGPIQAAAVSPDGALIATGGWDGTVRLWRMVSPDRESKFLGVRWGSINVTPAEVLDTLKGFTRPVRTLAFAPDGMTIAAASDEKLVRVWDLQNRVERHLLRAKTTALTYTPDGILVTAGGQGKTPTEVKLWPDWIEMPILTQINREALCVAASPNGKLLAVGFPDGSVRIWDLKLYREVKSLPAHTKEVRCLAFSPDGQTLATGCRDQTVWLWNTDTWTTRDHLVAHPGEVKVIAFSPNGKTLVSGGGLGMLKVWNLETGEEVTTFRADKSSVGGLAFSPDGRTLVTAGWEKTAKLWNAAGEAQRP